MIMSVPYTNLSLRSLEQYEALTPLMHSFSASGSYVLRLRSFTIWGVHVAAKAHCLMERR